MQGKVASGLRVMGHAQRVSPMDRLVTVDQAQLGCACKVAKNALGRNQVVSARIVCKFCTDDCGGSNVRPRAQCGAGHTADN